MENFVITEFASVFEARDPQGRRTVFTHRKCACFIITVKGRIRFSYEGGAVIAEAGHPVFLPRGLTYVNECLESAQSYVFQFQTLAQYKEPVSLGAIPESMAAEYYERMRGQATAPSLPQRLWLMEELYALARRLLAPCAAEGERNPVVSDALLFMREHYGRAGLTVGEVASACHVSEVYLRKLFEREQRSAPFRVLTKIRMERAKLLLEEHRPLKEIAARVGYADVFQFSRAYKRYFGVSPVRHQ